MHTCEKWIHVTAAKICITWKARTMKFKADYKKLFIAVHKKYVSDLEAMRAQDCMMKDE